MNLFFFKQTFVIGKFFTTLSNHAIKRFVTYQILKPAINIKLKKLLSQICKTKKKTLQTLISFLFPDAGPVNLDIYKYSDPLARDKERVCSLPATAHHGYNATDLLLDPGTYRLLFEVVLLGNRDITVAFDNFTLLNENCTFDVIEEGQRLHKLQEN